MKGAKSSQGRLKHVTTLERAALGDGKAYEARVMKTVWFMDRQTDQRKRLEGPRSDP